MLSKRKEMALSAVFTVAVILNIIIFPPLSIIPFQWLMLIIALFLYLLVKNATMKRVMGIIILLISVAAFFMDILGCLFWWYDILTVCLLVLFIITSAVNVVLFVKLLIDDKAES